MRIQDFPLAWRWTDSRYSVFPATVLSQLHPLESQHISRDLQYAREYRSDPRRSHVAHSADVSNETGRTWLRNQNAGLGEIVTIAWSTQCALRTNWQIFTDYWSSFAIHHRMTWSYGQSPAAGYYFTTTGSSSSLRRDPRLFEKLGGSSQAR
jgi:hypothetical protein